MARKKEVLFKSEEHTSRARAAAFLRELAEKIESGRVVLQQGSREVPVEVGDAVELEVSFDLKEKKRGTRRKLEVELEWYDGDASTGPVQLG